MEPTALSQPKVVTMPSTNGDGPKRRPLGHPLRPRLHRRASPLSGYSLAQQLEALREYAAREGYEVLEEVARPRTERRKP